MSIKCEVIQDLLPSYIDKITSDDSNELVKTHLSECDDCNDMYKEMSQKIPNFNYVEEDTLGKNEKKLAKRIKNKMYTIIITLMITFSVFGAWFYNFITDETYDGMSIIPEEHDDIPLYEGLDPRRSDYVIKGNHWQTIYEFYMKELPKHGWEVKYKSSALDDNDANNDWSGFSSRWTKSGFEGELSISASYNQYDNQTEVNFDQQIPPNSTTWIESQPESICVLDSSHNEECKVIEDPKILSNVTQFIDKAAYDVRDIEQQGSYGVIKFFNKTGEPYFKVNVHFAEKSSTLFFQSKKGVKAMKPEPEFFEMTNLTKLMD